MEEGINIVMRELIPQSIIYGKMLLVAIFVFSVGWWLIKKLLNGLNKVMELRDVDSTLRPFLTSVVSISLKLLLIISVISYIGIPMTSFVALLGAAGLAIGMAFSGTLQNFAGGIILLVLKPFKVGDFIEAQGFSGTVKEIQIFNTFLLTSDNKAVIIPNGGLATGSLINYSRMNERRVDLTFSIGYKDDMDKAKNIIRQVYGANPMVLESPAPLVEVMTLGESSVDIVCRVWVSTPNYWPVYFYMIENVKKEFDKNNIEIPFPQRDVYIHQ
jgi:small conductance mechanosensitive channel